MASFCSRTLIYLLIALFFSRLVKADIRLIETGAPRSKYISLDAPGSIPSNFTWIMPSGDGSANQCLATNGSGTLFWYTPAGAGGTGYSLNADDGSPTNALYVDATGKVGIGTTAPDYRLDVSASNESTTIRVMNLSTPGGAIYPGFVAQNYSGSTNGHPYLNLQNIRGSVGSPSALQSGDVLGALIFTGQTGAASAVQAARIMSFAEVNFSGATNAANLTFSTSGPSGSYAERM